MDPKFLLTKQDCLAKLNELGIGYVLHEHEPAPTMAHMLKVPVAEGTIFVKSLCYVDKKGSQYLVLANNTTEVGKLFWKSIGLSPGNIRLASQEKIQESIQSSIGNVNPFSLLNDVKSTVKKVVIDASLPADSKIAVVPVENNATVEVSLLDLQEKLLKPLNKDLQIIPLSDAAVEEELKSQAKAKLEQQEKPQEQNQQQLAITVKKAENFSKWYQQVITKAELIEYYEVSGCYILRPWSYFIWEQIQRYFDDLIRTEDVENTYFPMFICPAQLNKEKEHVEGFEAEVAWVTKYGKKDLNEPLAIRPTSETIMYPAFAKWVQSHRDLPLKVNQWTNIVRWEFKFPTPFLRTREFLWQEGHTAHATKEEAVQQVYKILDFYESVYRDLLAVPVVKGIKTESEKFAGGDFTTTVETIIPQNGRGLQGATSHHLGQNFSKMFEIEFQDDKKEKQFAWQTSWGLTTRSIGAMIMYHGDDQGLVLPPRVAKYQVVIVPIVSKEVGDAELFARCQEVRQHLTQLKVRAHFDARDNYLPGWKYNHWEQKGVPIRFEIGGRDYKNNEVTVVQRFDSKKYQLKTAELDKVVRILEEIHEGMFAKAKAAHAARIFKAENWNEFMTQLNKNNTIIVKWCLGKECEDEIKKKSKQESQEQDQLVDGQVQLTGAAKTLCMPLIQEALGENDKCFFCNQAAKKYVLWGRSY